MPYHWDGDRILQRNTSVHAVRVVVGHPDAKVWTDLRQWITSTDMDEVKRVLAKIDDLPWTKKRGEFDNRAGLVWQWVAKEIRYVSDENSQDRGNFYQFPAETIALGFGDCEDSAFLLASLLIASGISEYCVRVVMGSVKWDDNRVSEGHVWVVYKDETGIWRLIEPTLSKDDLPDDLESPETWPCADDCSKRGERPWYVPDLCLNQSHIWSIREIPDDVEGFVSRHKKKSTRHKSVEQI
ncbi:MAG: transglutaminase family protein [Litoreibacter sp.]